jgi:hypothetical protein
MNAVGFPGTLFAPREHVRTRWLEESESRHSSDPLETAVDRVPFAEGGIQIERLWAGDQLIVRTLDASYELMIVAPRAREVVIRGGGRFPGTTAARLEGCSIDGALVKAGAIAVGYAVELTTAAGPVTTMPVRAISFVGRG